MGNGVSCFRLEVKGARLGFFSKDYASGGTKAREGGYETGN